MCPITTRLTEVRTAIKFNKCFRDDESKALVQELRKEEISLMKDLKAAMSKEFEARIKYQEILIKEGYSYEEMGNMDLIELRDLVDELNPLVIVNASVTIRGGRSKKVTVIKK